MTIEEFKWLILNDKPESVIEDILLSTHATHCKPESQSFIIKEIAKNFHLKEEEINLIVVGSAKLGFSIVEKRQRDGTTLPRYRPFGPTSDIDIALVSPQLYDKLWFELSKYAYSQPYLPWDSGKLGDYLVCGWLRPDHFPNHVRLRQCDIFWDTFRYLSTLHSLGRRRIRGGLFHNFEQLKLYQYRALNECISFERNSI